MRTAAAAQRFNSYGGGLLLLFQSILQFIIYNMYEYVYTRILYAQVAKGYVALCFGYQNKIMDSQNSLMENIIFLHNTSLFTVVVTTNYVQFLCFRNCILWVNFFPKSKNRSFSCFMATS